MKPATPKGYWLGTKEKDGIDGRKKVIRLFYSPDRDHTLRSQDFINTASYRPNLPIIISSPPSSTQTHLVRQGKSEIKFQGFDLTS